MEEGRADRLRIAQVSIALFGVLALCSNLAVALHELGHAVGALLGGLPIRGVTLRPFGNSSVQCDLPPVGGARVLFVWGGITFATAGAVALLAAARRLRDSATLWVIYTGVATFALALNGMYMALGSLAPFNDADMMIRLGAPRPVLFLIGAALPSGSFLVFARLLVGLGLRTEDPLWRWVVAVEGAVFLYLSMIAAYFAWMSGANSGAELRQWAPFLAAFTLSFGPIAAVGWALARRTKNLTQAEPISPGWRRSLFLTALGLLMIGAEFVIWH